MHYCSFHFQTALSGYSLASGLEMVRGKKNNRVPVDPPKQYSPASGEAPKLGAIFMCNRATKEMCFRYGIFGLPSSFGAFVRQVKAGMLLFLFEYETRMLHGVYQACTDGQMNICPDAYTSYGNNYPAQVRFQTSWNCSPLSEEEFQFAIKDNYFTKRKFNFGLSRSQVWSLLWLFKSKVVPRDILATDVIGPSAQIVESGNRHACKNRETCTLGNLYAAQNDRHLLLSSENPQASTLTKGRGVHLMSSVNGIRSNGDKIVDNGSPISLTDPMKICTNLDWLGNERILRNEPLVSPEYIPTITTPTELERCGDAWLTLKDQVYAELDSSNQESDPSVHVDSTSRRKRSVFSRLTPAVATDIIEDHAEEEISSETNIDAVVTEVMEMLSDHYQQLIRRKKRHSKLEGKYPNNGKFYNVKNTWSNDGNTHFTDSSGVNLDVEMMSDVSEAENKGVAQHVDFKRRSAMRKVHEDTKGQGSEETSDPVLTSNQSKRRKLVRPLLGNKMLFEENTADPEDSTPLLKSLIPYKDIGSPLACNKEQQLPESGSSKLVQLIDGDADGSCVKSSVNKEELAQAYLCVNSGQTNNVLMESCCNGCSEFSSDGNAIASILKNSPELRSVELTKNSPECRSVELTKNSTECHSVELTKNSTECHSMELTKNSTECHSMEQTVTAASDDNDGKKGGQSEELIKFGGNQRKDGEVMHGHTSEDYIALSLDSDSCNTNDQTGADLVVESGPGRWSGVL